MKRVLIAAAVVFAVSAHGAAGQAVSEHAAASGLTLVGDTPLLDPALQRPPVSVPPAARPAPPTSPRVQRRLASMVGYIDDPIVRSKVRVRYELGFGNTVPDRAEFFYGKCGCYRDLAAALPVAYDPDAPGPGPGAANDLDFRQLFVFGEYAATDRVSVFAELPVRSIRPQSFAPGVPNTGGGFENHTGIGDLRAGAKLALRGDERYALTAQVSAMLPTGDARKGLGTDHASIEPSLLYFRQLTDRVTIETQGGVRFPIKGSDPVPITADDRFAGNVLFYGIGPSVEVYRSARLRVAPIVELVGWRVLDGMQTVDGAPSDAAGTNIVNMKFGARVRWNDRGSFYVGYGHALTKAVWYENIVRFEYRLDL